MYMYMLSFKWNYWSLGIETMFRWCFRWLRMFHSRSMLFHEYIQWFFKMQVNTFLHRRWSSIVSMYNICITFIQCRTNVFAVGPTLYKCYTNVLCFLVPCPSQCSYNVGPTVLTLVQHCTNVVQMFCVCWDVFSLWYLSPPIQSTSKSLAVNQMLSWSSFQFLGARSGDLELVSTLNTHEL